VLVQDVGFVEWFGWGQGRVGMRPRGLGSRREAGVLYGFTSMYRYGIFFTSRRLNVYEPRLGKFKTSIKLSIHLIMGNNQEVTPI
jgi:hypothetical protein